MSEQPFTALRVYDANGLQLTVSVPLGCESIRDFTDADALNLRKFTETLIRNGFTVNAPGVNEGEKIETVGAMCRRSRLNQNNEETPMIDLYPDTDNPEVKYKMVTIYLNNAEEVAEFVRGTGMELSDLPYYEGDQPLERWGKMSAKYLREPAFKPLRVVLKGNPAYNPEETDQKKKKPRWLFDRWYGAITKDASPNQPTGQNQPGSGDSPSGKNESTEHWAASESAQQAIKERFAKYNVTGLENILAAVGKIEPGVKRLRDSKIASLKDYLVKIDAVFGKAVGETADDVPF